MSRGKIYYAKNREKLKADRKVYYVKNREKALIWAKQYRAKNQEKIAARMNSYMRARTLGTPKEIAVENYLCAAIDERGGFCPKFIDKGRRGAPDRLVILPGHPTYFVELKRPKLGRLAPWQERYHEQLRACGQKVWVLSSTEEVDDFLLSL